MAEAARDEELGAGPRLGERASRAQRTSRSLLVVHEKERRAELAREVGRVEVRQLDPVTRDDLPAEGLLGERPEPESAGRGTRSGEPGAPTRAARARCASRVRGGGGSSRTSPRRRPSSGPRARDRACRRAPRGGDERAPAGQLVLPFQPLLEQRDDRGSPRGALRAGATTTETNRWVAARRISICGFSFESKWAKRPLFDMPTRSARRPIVTPASPSSLASRSAASTTVLRVASPFGRSLGNARQYGTTVRSCSPSPQAPGRFPRRGTEATRSADRASPRSPLPAAAPDLQACTRTGSRRRP